MLLSAVLLMSHLTRNVRQLRLLHANMISSRTLSFRSWNVFMLVSYLYGSLVLPEVTAANCSVPGPARDLAVHVDTYNFFTLTWDLPGNVPYSCIDSFKVCFVAVNESQHCSSSKITSFSNNAASPTSICTNYTATVTIVGSGGYSNGTSITFFTGVDTVYGLAASNTTATRTHLTWQSLDTQTCAKHFKLYHCVRNSSDNEEVCRAKILNLNTTYAILGGLEPCKDNQFRLATVDKYGGEYYTSIVVHTGNDHPPQPHGVRTTDNQGNSFAVSWLTPADFNPQCHGGYRMCFTNQRDDTKQCYFTSTNSSIVRRTTACTNYTIEVRTVDGELKEDSRRSVAATHRVLTQPSMPPVTIGFDSTRIASFSWPTPDNFSASCLKDYEVTECVQHPYTTGECKVSHRSTLPANTTSFNSSELTECGSSVLRFSVVSDGNVRTSMNLQFDNTEGKLQPLTNLTVVKATVKDLTLAWTPSDFNKCTNYYRVCWGINNGRTCNNSYNDRGDTFKNLNLAACHTYTAKIWAVGGSRNRNSSSTISTDFDVGPNNAPNQTVEVNSTSVLMTWARDTKSHTCSEGYVITWCLAPMYSVNCDKLPVIGNVTLDIRTVSHHITGLQPCTKYHIVFYTLGKNISSPSDESVTTIQTTIGKFGPITNLKIHQEKNNTVVLDIVFPYNSAKCITKFTTCLYETNSKNPEKYCRLMRTEWVNMTKSCTNYTVDITATTYNKLTEKGSITFRTGHCVVKDASVDIFDNDSLNVAWINSGEKAIRNLEYLEVKYNPEESSEPADEVRIPANSKSILLEGLRNFTTYNLQIQEAATGGIRGPLVSKKFTSTMNGNGAHSMIIKDMVMHIGLLLCVLFFQNHRSLCL